MAKAKKLPSGNWRVMLYVGTDENGKRKYKSFTAETKKQAEFEAAEYAIKRKEKPKDMTFGEALDRYIHIKSNVLSPATIREYKRSKRCDVPSLMGLPLSKITQEKIQEAINEEAANHSPKTVRNIHGLISAVLHMYMPDFRLQTHLPQKQKSEIYVPSDEDIQKLIQAAKGRDLELAIMLAAFGSLRRSEIAALTAEDIHGTAVSVNKAMVKDEDGKWVLKPPKTFSSYRTVVLPDFMAEYFEGKTGRLVNLVPGSITTGFEDLCKKVDISGKIRFHDLRHYQASILHAMNVPDKYIMERGGWKTTSTLRNVYQHTMDKKTNEVTTLINQHFEKMQHEMQHNKK